MTRELLQRWGRLHRRLTEPPRHWAPSTIRRLLRRPTFWWATVALMVAATIWLVNALTADALIARQQWGTTMEVSVATAQIEAGDQLAGAVERRTLPIVAVPDGALTDARLDGVARSRIHKGEVVIAARVSGRGTDGLAGRLPPGMAAVAVPNGPGWPPLAVGDLVDLHATVQQVGGSQALTQRVAARALVVDVGERAVTVAVPSDQVSATATALSGGAITVALVG